MLKTNGTPSVSPPVGSSDAKGEPSGRELSNERLSTPSLKDVSERSRTLSARSFDPLPDVPKLELAEGSNKKGEEGNDGDDNDDDDGDDSNPYAEVPRDDGMADSGSDGEGKSGEGAAAIPPYGKVSRHSKVASDAKDSEELDDTDSYAEVRDVMKRGLPLFSERERSHTQPPNPKDLAATPRDKRSQTESSAALMPLPDIPPAGVAAPTLLAKETAMYDSIEGQPKKKERLYESMDEVVEDEDKDLYESVPDSLTMIESPRTPTSLSTPTLAVAKTLSDVPPMPPSSPIPNRNEHAQQQQQQPSKKHLEKTLSASDEGKRRFSFFNRKKAASMSSTKPKKGDHPKGDQQPESPTVLVASSSPKHKSPPPLPNIPVPPPPEEEDEEEDTYDRVTPGVPPGQDTFQLGAAADDPKMKAMSLPMSYRTGGRPNIPLPKVPEDSGSGTVQHKRVMESKGGPDDYDMVQATPDRIPDEPNYDTVEVGRMMPPSASFDPPYDKIDKKELQELREKEMGSQERLRSSSPEDSTKYYVVRGEESVGNDQPGLPPDHDEEGYAVVPEEIKMRKRAMSASLAMKQKQKPESAAAGYRTVRYQDEQPYDTITEVRPHSMTMSSPSRGSSEAQYATVDMSAKRDKKQQELEEVLRMQEELRVGSAEPQLRASPVPPPLPPALDPEDLEEFKLPPIPHQSDGVHELLESGGPEEPRADSGDPPYARVKGEAGAKRKDSSDPPYARVNELDMPQPDSSDDPGTQQKDGSDPPYARVNELDVPRPDSGGDPETQQKDGSDPPYARVNELDVPQPDSGDPPYARVKSKTTYAEVNRPYAEVDVDWIQNQTGARSSGQSATPAEDGVQDGAAGADKEDKPYNTIQDLKADIESGASHQLELEMPKLEMANDGTANIYDSLLPDSPASGELDEEQVSSPSDTKRDTPRSMV